MLPKDKISLGCGYKLSDHWLPDFAASAAFTWDTTESKGTGKAGGNQFVDSNGNTIDPNHPVLYDHFVKVSDIDQFHSNVEFDHKQWQVNFGIAYVW